MKRLVAFLLISCFFLTGCSHDPNSRHSYDIDAISDFELHLSSLSDLPSDAMDFDSEYAHIRNWEDAITVLFCYVSERDGSYTQRQAEDAWIYLSHYISALESEFDKLEREYNSIYK